MENLADHTHPLVQQTARQLTADTTSAHEAVARIFHYVRDDILFGFPPEGDFVKASETLKSGMGQCNTKGTLFLALCRVAGIPARIHFSQITKEIQHGFFTGLAYWLVPNQISHSWIEVELGGVWQPVDSYINDIALHDAAVVALDQSGWITGFSVSRAKGAPSAELVLDGAHFSQMAAVSGDNGVYDEPAEFYAKPEYLNKVGALRQWAYRLMLPVINGRVARLRARAKPR